MSGMLEYVLKEYSQYYNYARPHQGLQQIPEGIHEQSGPGVVQRRDVLGGFLHDYYRDAA